MAAKTPDLLSIETLNPAELTIVWRAGEYRGVSASCTFSHWQVELARIFNGTMGPWFTPARDCSHTNRLVERCVVSPVAYEANGVPSPANTLESMTAYAFRMTERCLHPRHDSLYHRMIISPTTLPWPALVPENLTALAVGSEWMHLSWEPSDTRDCVFTEWHSERDKWGQH